MATASALGLWVCPEHRNGQHGRCLRCSVALDYNLFRQFCACGVPATGYRVMSAEAEVEFFCDEHFQDVPATGAEE